MAFIVWELVHAIGVSGLSRVTFVCVGIAKLGLFMMQFTPSCYGIENNLITNCDLFFWGLWWVVPGFIHAKFTRTKLSYGVFVLANLAHCKEEKIGKQTKRAHKSSRNSEPPHFCTNSQFQIFFMNLLMLKISPKNMFDFIYLFLSIVVYELFSVPH
jgi:hypothetical protein